MKLRKLLTGALLALTAFAVPTFSQAHEHSKAADQVSVQVARHDQPSDAVHYSAIVEKVARHCKDYVRADGSVDQEACAADPSTVFYDTTSHNLLTNAGKDKIAAQLSSAGAAASATAVCKWIALTNTAITPAAGDTTLSGEITLNGLGRAAAGTLTHTNGTSTFVIANTFTATGTQASQAAGVFDASSTGNMCFENTYTQVTLNNTDTLTVTWTITLS